MGPGLADGRRRGALLVEVMLAVLVLAVLVIGGSAFMFHSRATIAEQARKRQALDLANGRLEDIRATVPATLTNVVAKGFVGWLGKTGGVWRSATARFADDVVQNGLTYGVETAVDYRQTFMSVTTTVIYAVFPGNASKERLSLSTLYLPEQYYYQ